MRAVLKSLDLEPDPATLSDDPAEFSLHLEGRVTRDPPGFVNRLPAL